MKCTFCDTKYAWDNGKALSVREILKEVKKLYRLFPAEWICLTGGEPLLQDIDALVEALRKERFKIQVETNATLFRPLRVDWYSISPKPEKYFCCPKYREKAKEVKIIVTKSLNLEIIQHLRKTFPISTPLFLQPQSNKKWSINLGMKILKEASLAGLKNIRISLQLHKILALR